MAPVTTVAQEVVYDAVVVDPNPGTMASAPPEPHIAVIPSSPSPLPPPTAPGYSPQTPHSNCAANNNTSSRNPPQGCQDGGRWAQIRYSGNNTAILCVVLACCCGVFSLCGLCAFLCPQDVKNVYVVNAKVYDQQGKCLGQASKFRFE